MSQESQEYERRLAALEAKTRELDEAVRSIGRPAELPPYRTFKVLEPDRWDITIIEGRGKTVEDAVRAAVEDLEDDRPAPRLVLEADRLLAVVKGPDQVEWI